jgi:hypothetical protein
MTQSLKEFRDIYLDLLLNFLWRQWSALGVAGYAKSDDSWVIDPEALLIFTASIGRYEPRLFDEVLDWLDVNGRFINIQRLRTILKKEKFVGGPVISAIASLMSKRAAMNKWKRLAEAYGKTMEHEALFYHKNGEPLPVVGKVDTDFSAHGFRRNPIELRGNSQPFRPEPVTNLALRLRALFGVNARCEIMLYLLVSGSGHPRRISRETYYFQKTVQDTLVEMSRSGLILATTEGREKHYKLVPSYWREMLVGDKAIDCWITWPPLFSALERVWLMLNQDEILNLEPLLQASELRDFMLGVRPDIERAGLKGAFSDDQAYLGEAYTGIFLADVRKLLG